MGLLLLVDTNIVIHGEHPPWTWDMKTLTGHDDVTIVICREVLRELDRHTKNDQRSRAFQQRARERRALLVEYWWNREVLPRSNTVTDVRYDGAVVGGEGDAALLAWLDAQQREQRSSGLLTDDGGLATLARGQGIRTWMPPRNMVMSTFESKGTQEQLRLLRLDLDRLRAVVDADRGASATLCVSFQDGTADHAFSWSYTPPRPNRLSEMREEAIESGMEAGPARQLADQQFRLEEDSREARNVRATYDAGAVIVLRNESDVAARRVRLSFEFPSAFSTHIPTPSTSSYAPQRELEYSVSSDGPRTVLLYEIVHGRSERVLPFSWIRWQLEGERTFEIPFTLSAENAVTLSSFLTFHLCSAPG